MVQDFLLWSRIRICHERQIWKAEGKRKAFVSGDCCVKRQWHHAYNFPLCSPFLLWRDFTDFSLNFSEKSGCTSPSSFPLPAPVLRVTCRLHSPSSSTSTDALILNLYHVSPHACSGSVFLTRPRMTICSWCLCLWVDLNPLYSKCSDCLAKFGFLLVI